MSSVHHFKQPHFIAVFPVYMFLANYNAVIGGIQIGQGISPGSSTTIESRPIIYGRRNIGIRTPSIIAIDIPFKTVYFVTGSVNFKNGYGSFGVAVI